MDYGQAQNEAVEAYFDREARDRKSQEQRGGNEVNRSMLRIRQGHAPFLPGDHLLRLQNRFATKSNSSFSERNRVTVPECRRPSFVSPIAKRASSKAWPPS